MCGCPRLHFVHYYRILQISKSNMYIVHKYMSCVNIYTLYYIYYIYIYTTCDYKMCQVPLWFLLRCGSGRVFLSGELGRFSFPVRDRLKRVAY